MWGENVAVKQLEYTEEGTLLEHTYLARTEAGSWVCLAPFANLLPTPNEFMHWAECQMMGDDYVPSTSGFRVVREADIIEGRTFDPPEVPHPTGRRLLNVG